ncbi:MAG: hypothetical protein N4A49_07270 [Marinifilaceae bacterium]|jgi:hypothetical protein|nr:hypothetical protein [Marinifilaceae bacterium]
MKKKIDFNIFTGIGIMLVSFSALFVSMYQASIMNKQTTLMLQQTKAGAWPCLVIGKTELGDSNTSQIKTLYYTVKNKGTGPAIIRGVKLTYKGKLVKNWTHLHKVMNTPDSIPKSRFLSPLSKSIISAKEQIKFIDFSGNYKLINWILKHKTDLKIEIYYESVFNEMWYSERNFSNKQSSYPKRVNRCEIKKEEQFEN